MASYPSATKTYTTKAAGDTIQPAHINDVQEEIVALENGLLSGVAHTVLPVATNLYDLGSLAVRWRSGYFASTVNVAGNLILGGTITSAAALTLGQAPSGYGGAATAADNLVIQGMEDIGVTFATDNNARAQTIAFGAQGLGNADAFLTYNTGTRALTFGTMATTRMTLQSDGDLVLTQGAKLWIGKGSALRGAAWSCGTDYDLTLYTGTGASLTAKLVIDSEYGHLLPSNDGTQYLGWSAGRWSQLFVANGSAAFPSVSIGDADTGFYYDTTSSLGRVNLAVAGSASFTVRGAGASNGPIATVQSGPFGATASGAVLAVGHNTSSTGAAGVLILNTLTGTPYYLWVDGTGDLRIHTSPPIPGQDTIGVVVGSQS